MTVRPSNRPDGPPPPRPCPVCGGLSRRVLHRQRFLDGPLGNGYDVVVCGSCGAGFADGIPSQAELDAYYAEQSKYTYDQTGGAESPYDFRRFELIADQVVPFLPSPAARILDVGCATGGLLAVLQRRGFANVLGVDPSAACVAAARRLHGVDVRVAALGQLADWSERFDAVLVVGVLEHLREVRPALEIVRRLLAPGGLLYCAQPDVAAFADCVNAPYQQFSVEHVNFFSESSLHRLLATCGLTPLRTWRWLVEWREGVTDSVVSGLYSPAAEVAGSKSQVSGLPPFHTAAPQISSSAAPISEVPPLGSSGLSPTAEGAPRSPSLSPSPHLPQSLTPLLPLPSDLSIDGETGPALVRYLAQCRAADAALISVVERLVQSQEPILVWGAGTLTRRLLATTNLGRANIAAFIDSNVGLQGHSLAGRAVLSPAQIAGRGEAILIGSTAFAREIVHMIRSQLRLPNRVILLGAGGSLASE